MEKEEIRKRIEKQLEKINDFIKDYNCGEIVFSGQIGCETDEDAKAIVIVKDKISDTEYLKKYYMERGHVIGETIAWRRKKRSKKFGIKTSKIITECWEVLAENEEEALKNFWSKGKKVDEEVFEYTIEEIYEL